jgi:hypothetical protein
VLSYPVIECGLPADVNMLDVVIHGLIYVESLVITYDVYYTHDSKINNFSVGLTYTIQPRSPLGL